MDDEAPPNPSPIPAAPRRWLMGLSAALIIYGNFAVALQPPRLGATLLPRPSWLFDMFLLPGMFTSYTTTNLAPHLSGQRGQSGRASDRGQWITLELRDHFPQRLGITFTQLYAPHQREVLGTAGQREAWRTLARKIRARHNHLHPELAIVRVRIATLEWPIHPDGYRGAKRPDTVRLRSWFVEGDSQ